MVFFCFLLLWKWNSYDYVTDSIYYNWVLSMHQVLNMQYSN